MAIPIHTSQNIYANWDGAIKIYKVDANTQYVCKATVGTALNAKGWQIAKIYEDDSELRITWAEDDSGNASTDFIFTASLYSGYSYS